MSDTGRGRWRFVAAKTAQMLLVLLVLSVAVFCLARLCPGDPLRAYYGDGLEHMSEAEKVSARQSLGLDDALPVQYRHWVGQLLQGDLGISYQYKQPVGQVIGAVWQNTLLLGAVAYVLTFGLAILLGAFCARREGSRIDRCICRIGVISGSIPSFFLGLLLLLLFAVQLDLLPAGGAYSYGRADDAADRILHLILPVTVMVLEHLWYYAYMVRNKLMTETRRDYVLLCKAAGLSRRRILYGRCLRNILPSMLVVMAMAVPHILGGTYVVEMVFSYPGLGMLSFQAALYQDYNMLMALCMLTGCVVLVANLAAQLLGEWIDPRMADETVRPGEGATA